MIIVCGLTLLMGYTGQVSLGHAGFYALGAYIPAVLVSGFNWPLPLAVAAGIVGTGLISLAVGGSILRLKGNHLALATLAIGIIIWKSVGVLKITGAADGITGLPEITLFGLLSNPEVSIFGLTLSKAVLKLYFVWAVAGACIIWAIQLCESPIGRHLRAIEGDESAAESLGIDTFALKVKVFVASSVLAAVAGTLYAFVHAGGYLGPEEFEYHDEHPVGDDGGDRRDRKYLGKRGRRRDNHCGSRVDRFGRPPDRRGGYLAGRASYIRHNVRPDSYTLAVRIDTRA